LLVLFVFYDVVTIERYLPNSLTKHVKWRETEGGKYYLPGEIGAPIGKEWFFREEDKPRSDEELFAMSISMKFILINKNKKTFRAAITTFRH
jgi:hypothetical protein